MKRRLWIALMALCIIGTAGAKPAHAVSRVRHDSCTRYVCQDNDGCDAFCSCQWAAGSDPNDPNDHGTCGSS